MRDSSDSKPKSNSRSRDAISPDVGKATATPKHDQDKGRYLASIYTSDSRNVEDWVRDTDRTYKAYAVQEAASEALGGHYAIVIDCWTDTIILNLEPTPR